MSRPSHTSLAVILAAGGGVRMGLPKGLLCAGDHSLIALHVDALRPRVDRVIVVLGARSETHPTVEGASVILNPDWSTTRPSDSLRLALRAHPAGTCLVTPVDTPPAMPETLDALLTGRLPAVPVDPSGARGHPVLLGPTEIRRVLTEPLPEGLRGILAHARLAPVDQADVAIDFDTPVAWAAWLASRGDG